MDYKVYALMAILLASVASVALVGTANAQTTTELTVETDADSYTTGDTITVTGQLTATPIDRPLLIQVYFEDQQDAPVRFDQFDAAADGSYSYKFKAGGLMNTDGTYTVRVSYKTTEATTTFEFDATEGPPTGWSEIDAMIGGEAHTIEYRITGGRLVSVTGDPDTFTLTATVSTTADGTLSLRFDEEIFDADETFAIIADDVPVDELPPGPGSTNTLEIDFEAGTEEIVIIGERMIPEFGAIAAIVLAVAIVGIIIATARYGGKFNFTPRL
jgi:predicted secreted protein with PEFG-CTERM motif